ncbi:MAG TPA: hypothetical protein VGN91_00640 [Bosea sp. (in: a-proteobacteria)]|jgi:hypothetical protein|nr:hypothetical protein [Bosea sp. (in: a-proteobacteria)]
MSRMENGLEDELRGRLVCLETLLMTFIAHTARHVDETGGDLLGFTATVLEESKRNLLQAAHEAAGTDHDAAALQALQDIERLTEAALLHTQRYLAAR